MNTLLLVTLTIGAYGLRGPHAHAAIDKFTPELVRTAEPRKSSSYLQHGLFVGGDRDITDVVVQGIRHSKSPEFERLVIDLVGNRQGDPVAIQRPPYYQIAVNPELRRLMVTLWGRMKLEFDPLKVSAIGRNSDLLRGLALYPPLEQDRWTFEVKLKSDAPVEVFELSDPVRVIVDLRTGKQVAENRAEPRPKPAPKKKQIKKDISRQIKSLDDAEAPQSELGH